MKPIASGIAENVLPIMKLQYFSPGYVKYILVSNIEKRLFEANRRSTVIESIVWVEGALKFPQILKLDKRGLKGLGDIELFSLTELSGQTGRGQFNIYMAVTADKALRNALRSGSLFLIWGFFWKVAQTQQHLLRASSTCQ
jgi:hypothetical protein